MVVATITVIVIKPVNYKQRFHKVAMHKSTENQA